jgi:para-aminobenzoate synthetase component 1
LKRIYHTFKIEDIPLFKLKLLQWSAKHNIVSFLDNHQYDSHNSIYECLAGVGSITKFDAGEDFFSSLSSFVTNTGDWIFGHLNYDIKNFIEDIYSHNTDNINFPDVFLFVPEIVLFLQQNQLIIGVIEQDANAILHEIESYETPAYRQRSITITPRISKEQYIDNIQKIQQHILHGECYEINYCQEFYAQNTGINPAAVYQLLTAVSPNPFCSFYKIDDKYLLCSSPERYLKKEGENIISQPIKGTAKRGADIAEDLQIKQNLSNNKKERKENIIVVDLVRNDLSKVCIEGSVNVQELCEVYTFPGVHQMISTVKGKLQPGARFGDIIKATFPMGSMTGAPKKRVMQLIEKYEQTKRGIYSGTVGYITPEKDFDFNVVIRSIMYNETNKYLSYQAGSAITFESDPESEFEECLLKASAMTRILKSPSP